MLPVLAVLLLVAGCIPSAPEATPPQNTPAAAQPSPVAPAAAAGKPDVQAQSLPPDDEGKARASLKIDPNTATPNVSVTVAPLKDAPGFSVQGTFNLTGTIVPTSPGKWRFTGQFSMAEPDFAVGLPSTASMGTFAAGGAEAGMNTDTSMMMIAIPVSPPATQAPQGAVPRVIPVSLDLDAPEKTQFTVSLTQM